MMHMQQEIDQYEKLFQVLDRVVILSKQQQENVRKFFKYQELPKDYQLLKEGEISNYLYFLVKGVVRQFYCVEDKEITSRFAFEDDFIYSPHSFISRKQSKENIKSVSNCQFFVTTYEGLQYLYDNDPAWNKIGRLLIEHYYIELAEWAFLMKTQTAFERYEDLVQRHPDILDRVKLGHLASYLGITQETLSRIRARYRNQQRRRHLAQEI
ncbi:Crp/Fnr family transcriptional regulator [Nostoc sp. FACHB-133]|uniref:Crp/Fnr family transcriptional regulator n=1 Tax=Nostoc sp. FACHB-133 TaxID=2692835 RepID=UPI001F5534BE|nr:Crp/Fnr family transcriptional regulator [Nostoc sp. FACHB-133]